MPEAPAAPSASGPQEAATPLSLAAEWEDDAHVAAQQGASPFTEVAYAVRTCAEDVRQRLAPAWDALAAGNERLRAALDRIVREEPEEWLHEHGPTCELNSCELAELAVIREIAREAIGGDDG